MTHIPATHTDTRAMNTENVHVGDIIVILGTPHMVDSLEDYTHPVVTHGETWKIARAADGWGITVTPPEARWRCR